MQTSCPQCQSQQTSSYEMLWLNGTSTGNFAGVGGSLGGNVGGFTGISHQQSYLAARVAPPLLPDFHWARFGCALPFAIAVVLMITYNLVEVGLKQLPVSLFRTGLSNLAVILTYLAIFGGLLGSLLWRRFRFQREQLAYQQQAQAWKASWLCLQCGQAWLI